MSEPAVAGERLRAERERRGISIPKAADAMHLDTWVIEALERDDYRRVGPAVFAKGHLRKYAEILGLPPGELLQGFDSRYDGASAVAVAPRAADAAAADDGESTGAPVAGLVLAAIAAGTAAGMWWWKPWQSRADAPVPTRMSAVPAPAPPVAVVEEASAPAAQVTAVADATLPTQPAAAPARAVNTLMAAKSLEPSQPQSASPAAAAPRSATEPGAGRARLRMSFSADARVEVRDATGRLIYGGVGQANSVKQLAGAAPLHVFLSDAGGVQLEINDHAVAISSKFLSGGAARFDAGADGVLRREPATALPRPHG